MGSKATYVLYRGDEILDVGTLDEIARRRNVKPETIYFYSTPTYRKRSKNPEKRLLAVRAD